MKQETYTNQCISPYHGQPKQKQKYIMSQKCKYIMKHIETI